MPDEVPDLDIEHDTFDTFSSVFETWPYIAVHAHQLHGSLLVLGQLTGTNKRGQPVYRACALGGDSFSKVDAIAEYERKGASVAIFRIKVLRLRPGVAKFWVHVDDPAQLPRKRDIDALYRYVEITDAIRQVNAAEYAALLQSRARPADNGQSSDA